MTEALIKTSILSLCLLCFLSRCGNPRAGIERIQENGVEVVLNPQAPPRPVSISLTKVFSLNTGRDELVSAGLTEFDLGFDVDSQGFIYTGCLKNTEGPIFKFDRKGNLLLTFSHVGQGPGEIQGEATLKVSSADEIVVTNVGSRRILFFTSQGHLLREMKVVTETASAVPLPGGGFVAWSRILDPESEFLAQYPLCLTGPEFEVVRELDRQLVPNPLRGGDFLGTFHVFSWSVSPGRVYSAFQDRGYDVWVHDFKGNLIRKIRKDFVPVPVSQDFKAAYLRLFEAPLFDGFREKIHFPASMPPLDSIFSDDKGRLYVLTYEIDPDSGASLFDVFDAAGSLEGRMKVTAFHDDRGCAAKVRNGRLYIIAEDDTGEKELVVYEIARQ
jgi:hypothetical protein